MTHEMIRREAREAGYDVDDLPPIDRDPDDELSDDDLVNVWEQLPDADTIPVEESQTYGEPDETPDQAEVDRLTAKVDRLVSAGQLPSPTVQAQEFSDTEEERY